MNTKVIICANKGWVAFSNTTLFPQVLMFEIKYALNSKLFFWLSNKFIVCCEECATATYVGLGFYFIQLLPVWLQMLNIKCMEEPWKNPHWWKTIQLFNMWQEIQELMWLAKTQKNPHWWETIQLFKVQEEVQCSS